MSKKNKTEMSIEVESNDDASELTVFIKAPKPLTLRLLKKALEEAYSAVYEEMSDQEGSYDA